MNKFSFKKTFGMAVLFKIAKKTNNKIVIVEDDGRYYSNLQKDELCKLVGDAMDKYNINLESK